MDIFTDITTLLVTMPVSTIFVILVNIGLALVSMYATKRVVNLDELEEKTNLVKEWQKTYKARMEEARYSGDPELIAEMNAEASRMMKMQGSLASARMKPCCYTYIPFIIIWMLLSSIFLSTPVAVLPFNPQDALPFLEPWLGVTVDGGFGLYFWTFYIMTGMGLGSLIRRISGQGQMAGI